MLVARLTCCRCFACLLLCCVNFVAVMRFCVCISSVFGLLCLVWIDLCLCLFAPYGLVVWACWVVWFKLLMGVWCFEVCWYLLAWYFWLLLELADWLFFVVCLHALIWYTFLVICVCGGADSFGLCLGGFAWFVLICFRLFFCLTWLLCVDVACLSWGACSWNDSVILFDVWFVVGLMGFDCCVLCLVCLLYLFVLLLRILLLLLWYFVVWYSADWVCVWVFLVSSLFCVL